MHAIAIVQMVQTTGLRSEAMRLNAAAAQAQEQTMRVEAQIAALESALTRVREKAAATLRAKRTDTERLEEAAGWFNDMAATLADVAGERS